MGHSMKKAIAVFLCLGLFFQQTAFAQVAGSELSLSGYFNRPQNYVVADKFRPAHLRYFSYDAFRDQFRVLLDKGDAGQMEGAVLKENTRQLLDYFLIGVTLPNDVFWVNLRPDAPDQIIDPVLAQTDLGKIFLEADLQLKKDTARFTSPQTPEGRDYWKKLYKKAGELFGTENVTIPTLTRPWIVPGEIIIRETEDSAYIYKASLKVMLESDYLKSSNNPLSSSEYNFSDPRLKALNEYSAEIIREQIIPKLTKDINISQRYAPLRQVFYSLILSRWFKSRFTGKSGTYASLINTGDLSGLTSKKAWSKTFYFKEYQKSFKDGEYNIQEPIYSPYGQTMRSYFSGGLSFIKMGEGVYARAPLGVEGVSARSPLGGEMVFVQDPLSLEGGYRGGPIKIAEWLSRRMPDMQLLAGAPGALLEEVVTAASPVGAIKPISPVTKLEWNNQRAGQLPVYTQLARLGAVSHGAVTRDQSLTMQASNGLQNGENSLTIYLTYQGEPGEKFAALPLANFSMAAGEYRLAVNPEVSRRIEQFVRVDVDNTQKDRLVFTMQVLSGQQEKFSSRFPNAPKLEVYEVPGRVSSPTLGTDMKRGLEFLAQAALIDVSRDAASGKPYDLATLRARAEGRLDEIITMVRDRPQEAIATADLSGYEGLRGLLGYNWNVLQFNRDRYVAAIQQYFQRQDLGPLIKAAGDAVTRQDINIVLPGFNDTIGDFYTRALVEPASLTAASPARGSEMTRRTFLGALGAPALLGAQGIRVEQRNLEFRDIPQIGVVHFALSGPVSIAGNEAIWFHLSGKTQDGKELDVHIRNNLSVLALRENRIRLPEGERVLPNGKYSIEIAKVVYGEKGEQAVVLSSNAYDHTVANVTPKPTEAILGSGSYDFLKTRGITGGGVSLGPTSRPPAPSPFLKPAPAAPPQERIQQDTSLVLPAAAMRAGSPALAVSPAENEIDFLSRIGLLKGDVRSGWYVRNDWSPQTAAQRIWTGDYQSNLNSAVRSAREKLAQVKLADLDNMVTDFGQLYAYLRALNREIQSSSRLRTYPAEALINTIESVRQGDLTIDNVTMANADASAAGLRNTVAVLLNLKQINDGMGRGIVIEGTRAINGMIDSDGVIVTLKETLSSAECARLHVYGFNLQRDVAGRVTGRLDDVFGGRAPQIVKTMFEATIRKANIPMSVSSPLNLDTSQNALGFNPLQKAGGIDFRTMEMMIQPMGRFNGLDFTLPALSQVQNINVDEELQQVRNMVDKKILPSGERIKELLAAIFAKKELERRADDFLVCLVDICRLQEELVDETSPQLREALVIFDTQKFVVQ
jgi:hypothetical protein